MESGFQLSCHSRQVVCHKLGWLGRELPCCPRPCRHMELAEPALTEQAGQGRACLGAWVRGQEWRALGGRGERDSREDGAGAVSRM